jgi:hypothetical protein
MHATLPSLTLRCPPPPCSGDLLSQLPGAILGLSFNPTPAPAPSAPASQAASSSATSASAAGALSAVVYSAGGLCHVDLGAPVPGAPLPGQDKRRRGAVRPSDAAAAAAARGRNCRLLPLEHPCLSFGFCGPDCAVLVERPWGEVLQQLPPPLHRQRYGA